VPKDPESDAPSEFSPIVSTDLKQISVVAQCLDNQWVRQDLLADMLRRGLSFADRAVLERRRGDARAEYLRALLNAEQVVVNRAFFYNNPVVYQDFARPTRARETFKDLLNTHVLVPYLLDERSPGEPPSRLRPDDTGWQAWREVLAESAPQCVRLSWDDAQNQQYLRTHMFGTFREFLGRVGVFDPDGLAVDLGIDRETAEAVRRRLVDVSIWAMNEDTVTRESFYERYVVADGTKPADGRYDAGKPFAGELKQLADLRYATTLPDVLDRYPLTPADSLHRTAMQEYRILELTRAPTAVDTLLDTLLRRQVFDLAQQPLTVSLSGLELPHVWQARQTAQWHEYIRTLRALVDSPVEFADRAQDVYDSYVRLAGELSRFVGDRRRESGPTWLPVIKVVIEVLGAALSIVYTADPFVQLAGEVAERVAGVASKAVVRFVVTGYDRRVARNELSTGIEIMKLKLGNTSADWHELIAKLRERGLPIRRAGSDDVVDEPGMDSTAEDD
jgi:hypothetical protein